MGKWQPYVGVGVQYINFFDTGTGINRLGATEVTIDDAWASRSRAASTSVSAMAGRSIST